MASLFITQLKAELLVDGFVNKEYNKEIPAEIIRLCFAFFFIKCDIWNSKRKHGAIEVDETTNTIKTAHKHDEYAHIAGSILISKSVESKIWKFLYVDKGNQHQPRPYFMITLMHTEHNIAEDGGFPFQLGFAYDSFYNEPNFDYEEYGLQHGEVNQYELEDRLLKTGEILTVKYKTVQSKENGSYYGELHYGLDIADDETLLIKGFDNIPIENNESYTIVASFHEDSTGETLQMLQ